MLSLLFATKEEFIKFCENKLITRVELTVEEIVNISHSIKDLAEVEELS